MVLQGGKRGVGKRVAPAPLAVKKEAPKKVVNPLIEKKPRNFGIGRICLDHALKSCSNFMNFRSGYPAQERSQPIRQMAQVHPSPTPQDCSYGTSEGAPTSEPVPSNPGPPNR